MRAAQARELWRNFEPLHAVTYFSPTCTEAFKALGLRGFWMGYFAGRAAPMGAVDAPLVTATFYNFEPNMVARALPDAWSLAAPADVVAVRRRAAAAVLRSTCPSAGALAPSIVELLGAVVERAPGEGRPLFSANRALGLPADPVESLWQLATSLREQRGDGHVAALGAHDLRGVEAIALFARCEGIDDELFRASRGWSEDAWRDALGALESQGLLGGGRPTGDALELRASIEETTDRLAARPFDDLDGAALARLEADLGTLAAELDRASVIPYPNPVGLTRPSRG